MSTLSITGVNVEIHSMPILPWYVCWQSHGCWSLPYTSICNSIGVFYWVRYITRKQQKDFSLTLSVAWIDFSKQLQSVCFHSIIHPKCFKIKELSNHLAEWGLLTPRKANLHPVGTLASSMIDTTRIWDLEW